MSKIKADFQVKLIVVGDVGVGKTYITHVFGNKLDQIENRQKVTAGILNNICPLKIVKVLTL